MEKRFEVFNSVMNTLMENNALDNLILIGSWCLPFYKSYFGNTPEIPVLRTMDIDFLIPRPLKVKREIDIDSILRQLGFISEFSRLSGAVKFVHPELEIEFLTPEFGRGDNESLKIQKLHINAQRLRYLTLLQKYIIEVPFGNGKIKIPEPPAYVLHKFILSRKRKDQRKKKKDIFVAIGIGEYLLETEHQRERLKEIYIELPGGWRKILNDVTKESSEKIFTFLVEKNEKIG
jgi:hypothetical protein